jgi:hypothetical protein
MHLIRDAYPRGLERWGKSGDLGGLALGNFMLRNEIRRALHLTGGRDCDVYSQDVAPVKKRRYYISFS